MKYFKPLLVVAVLTGLFVAYNFIDAESQDGEMLQPIAFSHKVHAGDSQIPCQYCHYNARKTDHPAVPSVKACMGCHKFIPGSNDDYDYEGTKISFQVEIDKLKTYWQDQKPIPWVKLHFVPQHAHFKHRPHIRAGVECSTCHGAVEEMDLVKPVNRIEMGFCIKCHKQRQATPEQQIQMVHEGRELVYLRDCATCHY